MGKRGPKAMPTAVATIKGCFKKDPQRARQHEPKPPAGKPRCPAHVGKRGKAEWKRVTGILEAMRVLSQADVCALEQYVIAYEGFRDALDKSRELGQVLVYRESGKLYAKRNPYDVVRERNAAMCIRLLSEFGLTPSSRTSVHVDHSDPVDDPYEAMMRARETA